MNNPQIEKIDSYIEKLYEEALRDNESKNNRNDWKDKHEEYGVKYYFNLMPLALIILRSEIILFYMKHQDLMPSSPKEIISKKILSGISEYYCIEEKLQSIIPYHTQFDGREADWVLVAVWLWMDKREMNVSPSSYFKSKSKIFELSRKYIMENSKSDECVFSDYFKGAEYQLLVDKYDISKNKLSEYLDLPSLNTKIDNLSSQIKESNDDIRDKIIDLSNHMGPSLDSSNPHLKDVLDVLKEVLDNSNEVFGKGAFRYVRTDNNDVYVIAQWANKKEIINYIQDIRDQKGKKFNSVELMHYLKEYDSDTSKIRELKSNTVRQYLKQDY